VFTSYRIQAQVGIGTTTPLESAQLDVTSTSKGFLPPRMTSAQRGNITSPVAGLMVYQTDATAGFYLYNGTAWVRLIADGAGSLSSGLKFSNLNSTTPTSAGATLGVDASGNVVTVPGTSFSPSFGSSRISTTINVSAGQSALLTSITLPTTGTYLINYTMRVQSMTGVVNQYAVGYLSDVSTPGTPIVGTEILGAFTAGTATVSGGNYSGSYIVTTTTANKVLYFMGIAVSGAMGFIDDGNGRTQISYVKVTP
jgi:hypothetical protein